MRSLRLILGLFVVLAATVALAQTGSIQGTVTDSVGAVVQGAEITVKNLGSNAVRSVTSSGTGAFSLPTLPPGNYDVTVKVASFKTFHVSDLPLTVGQVLPLNVQRSLAQSRKKFRFGLTRFPTLTWKHRRSAIWWIRGPSRICP